MNPSSLELGATRQAERSGTFIKARLEQAGLAARDVVVRNLSESGALIDGKDLPTSGIVSLVRGELSVEARVLRFEGRQRGLHFRQPIQLQKWLPHLALRDIVAASEDERGLDDLAALPDAHRRDMLPPVANLPIHARLAEELALLERKFGQILDAFADDPAILARHARSMTRLEAAQQLMARFADMLTAEDAVAAALKIADEDVRRRVLRR